MRSALLLLLLAPIALRAQSAPASDTAALHAGGVSTILVGEAVLATEPGGSAASAARTARAASAMARAYQEAGRSPAVTSEVLARAITNHLAGVPTAASAQALQQVDEQLFRLMLLQAAQNARLVEQNDRIIVLLQEIAAKK